MQFLPFGKNNFRQIIQAHMGQDPTTCPVVTEQFEKYNHPNIHLAIEAFSKLPGCTVKILGIQGGFMNFTGVALSELVSPNSMASYIGFGGAKPGPVQYTNIPLDGGRRLACVQNGLFLFSGDHKLTVMMPVASAALAALPAQAQFR